MMHREFEAPEELRDAIKCCWYFSRDFGEQESAFEIMPDGNAEIVFMFGNACNISIHGDLQPLPSPFIMGLLNQPIFLQTTGKFEVIGVRCYPWTVFDLLGLPSVKEGVDLFEHSIASLQPVLNEYIKAGKIDEALAHVIRYFLDARSEVAADSMLHKAGTAMRAAKGTLPVSEVAAAAHATVRALERKFKQSSGYTVKDVSGLMRFEQVRNHLWLNPGANLAGLALELGYADQPHLSREFKRYSGTTPAAFARKARKEKLMVIKKDFVAFMQAKR
jgi:AraC-like DNA-binding protein